MCMAFRFGLLIVLPLPRGAGLGFMNPRPTKNLRIKEKVACEATLDLVWELP
jgi:hypothetical protein